VEADVLFEPYVDTQLLQTLKVIATTFLLILKAVCNTLSVKPEYTVRRCDPRPSSKASAVEYLMGPLSG
jgi:hypothetical protein